jgi:hypothetical protein
MKVEIKPRRFLLYWFIAGAVVLPLSVVVSLRACAGFLDLVSRFADNSSYGASNGYNLFCAAVFGLVSGLNIGILQSIIVRRTLGLRLAGWWRVSTLGGLLAGVITWTIAEPYTLYELGRSFGLPWFALDYSVIALDALVFLSVLSFAQVSVLRKYSSGAWRWIAAHIGAISLTALFLLVLSTWQVRSSDYVTVWVIFGLSPVTAAVTGVAMYRMLLPGLRNQKSKRQSDESAQSIQESVSVKPSVWDGAI